MLDWKRNFQKRVRDVSDVIDVTVSSELLFALITPSREEIVQVDHFT